MRIAKHSRRGITRSDVVVIVVVAALLLIVALPTLNRWRGDARRTTCLEHQRRLAQAVLRYESSHGRLPGYRNLQAVRADGTRQPTGWVFPLLPFLAAAPGDQNDERKSTNEPPPVDPNDPYMKVFTTYGAGGLDETRGEVPRVFLAKLVCPSDAGEEIDERSTSTSYVANTGWPDERRRELGLAESQLDGVFFDRFGAGEVPEISIAILEQRDQLSSTLLLSENVDAGNWSDHNEPLVGFVWRSVTAPGEAPSSDVLLSINRETGQGDGSPRFARPSSHHPGGVNVMYCDGRGNFMHEEIDYTVLCRLMSPDDALIDLPSARNTIISPDKAKP